MPNPSRTIQIEIKIPRIIAITQAVSTKYFIGRFDWRMVKLTPVWVKASTIPSAMVTKEKTPKSFGESKRAKIETFTMVSTLCSTLSTDCQLKPEIAFLVYPTKSLYRLSVRKDTFNLEI